MSQYITQPLHDKSETLKTIKTILLPGQTQFGQGNVRLMINSGRFNVPPFVNKLRVSVQGGGGDSSFYSAGGGGGGFATGIVNVGSAESFTITLTKKITSFGNPDNPKISATAGEDGICAWNFNLIQKKPNNNLLLAGGRGGNGFGGDYQRRGGNGGDTVYTINKVNNIIYSWMGGGGGSAGFGGGFNGGGPVFYEGYYYGVPGCGGAGIGGEGGYASLGSADGNPPNDGADYGAGGGSGSGADGEFQGRNIFGIKSDSLTYITGAISHDITYDKSLSYYKFDDIGIPLLCRGSGGDHIDYDDPSGFSGGGGSGTSGNDSLGGDSEDAGNGGFGGGGGAAGYTTKGGDGGFIDPTEEPTPGMSVTEPGNGGDGGYGGGGGSPGVTLQFPLIPEKSIGMWVNNSHAWFCGRPGIGGKGFVLIEW